MHNIKASARPFLTLAFASVLAFPVSIDAQARVSSRDSSALTTATGANATSTNERRVLTLDDYPRWNRITSTSISPDGQWMTYAYQPNEGDATLYVRNLESGKQHTITVASQPQFSADSRWVAYFVSPPSRAGGARGGRGGTPPNATPPSPTPGRGGGAQNAQQQRRFVLMNLATGDTVSLPNAQSFKFAPDAKFIAVRANRANNSAQHQGADLVLRELATGAMRNIGNVNLHEFDATGRYFAYTVSAADKLGNGVYLVDLNDGSTRLLDGAPRDYDQLAWDSDATRLVVLRGEKNPKSKLKDNVLLAWTGIGTKDARSITYDITADQSAPKGFVVSEFSQPRFNKDGTVIYLGIKEQEAEPERSNEPVANVDVWHWKDTEPQSQQLVRLNQERRTTWSSVLDIKTNKLTRLADSAMRSVSVAPNHKWGIGRLDRPYRGEVAWGGSRADYYRVNIATGERMLIEKSLTRTMGTSPDGRWFLYLKDGKVFAYDLDNARTVEIDKAANVSFVDTDDDHPYELPAYGVAGWSSDGKHVLLNHKYDVWQLALDGTRAVNVTAGVGEREKIRFRIVRFDRARATGGRGGGGGFGGGAADDDNGIDLTKPLLYSAYGDRTKKSGYWRGMAGKAPTPVMYEDKNIGTLQKAEKADKVIFTQQTFNEFPDYWVSNTSLASPKKVTDANPHLAEYAWGTKKLIDYTDARGNQLQATLTLPANYEPGKKYPMLVYFYEKMSQTHHSFSMPTYDDRPHISTYASDGYLVLQPDVVYTIGRPGTSAVDDVTSAVKKVIELGYADPARIGLQGHSWGGYQSSYIITQTDMFAATVTGAPPTNLVSFYDQLYKQTGTVQQGIMEVGQVRMGADSTPWTAKELYESQSPVHNVQNIKTPFMILHGTADGAVDWVQGLEYFNAARRNGKNVILLSYPDEPHHLAKRENQKDFQIRMKQYFDHYLKGAPAPRWMTDGVPAVRKGEPIR